MDNAGDFLLSMREEFGHRVLDLADALYWGIGEVPSTEDGRHFGEVGDGFLYADDDHENTRWFPGHGESEAIASLADEFGWDFVADLTEL